MINWFKKKDKYYTLSKYLNRYQIQIYDYNKDMLYVGLHEGFTFDDACQDALIELKKLINIKL